MKNISINGLLLTKDEKNKNCNNSENSSSAQRVSNHIYFYCAVNESSVLSLRQETFNITSELMKLKYEFGGDYSPRIYLHINSYGGVAMDALNAYDLITTNEVPIVTIIEGTAASAATIMSVGGAERWITKNSCILIHQIRGGVWGKQSEIEEETKNFQLLERIMLDIYSEKTKLSKKELKSFIQHELYWDSATALEKGFVDKII